ncbi:hypothetical protein C0992_013289 [Termitomyces sp. T32_za158]|nr:hypothetical protein C0992_013289 [Termitomyces sp. T32_za158]
MKAHVIAFESPVQKVFDILPPPREEMNDVLAILFTGPSMPTPKDLARTPLLVRRKFVLRALKWLKLNHTGYQNIDISYTNLNGYADNEPPVSIVYREQSNIVSTVTPSVFNVTGEEGIIDGDCHDPPPERPT